MADELEGAPDLNEVFSALKEKGNDSLRQYVKSNQTTTPVNTEMSRVEPSSHRNFSTEDGPEISDFLNNSQAWANDRYSYARPFTYGAGWRNMNFERYYNSAGFKELGFDPFRDNEAVYNQNTSLWDDFKRAAPQFVKLGYYGSKHMVAPWTADDDASDYQRAMSVGQTSREGVGAFGINLGLNMGYTAGIIGEMAAEEGALALATIGSAGTAAEVTVPTMAAEAARAGKSIMQSWKFLNSVKNTFNAVKSASDARKVYELAKSGTAAVAKFVNPFENVAEFTSDAVKGLNGVNKLSDYAKIHKGVGSFVRDLKNIKATWGESNLEGGMAENEQRENLIHEFYDKNGRLPETQEEIADIANRAKQTGLDVTLSNLGLIYLSNKIVFDTAFKGMPTMKKLLAESTEDLGSKVIVGGVGEEAKAVSKYSLRGLREGLTPYNLLKGSLRYSTKNLTEGVQESAQDIISSAYKDYYDPKYTDEHLAAYPSLADSFKKGFAEQFSKQGWETFASGFLMGGMIQGPQKLLFNAIPKAFHKITDAEGYSAYKKQKEDYINSVVNAINDPRTKIKDYVNTLYDNFANQKRAVKSITDTADDGDTKAFKDVQDEAMFDHIHTLLRTGREGYLKEQLSGLKEMNDKELSEAFDGLDAGEARKRIASYENRVDDLKDRYEKIEQQFPNPFELNTVDKKKNPEGYADMQLKHNVFNFYKKQILFAGHTFDRILDRMEGIQNDMSQDKPLANAPVSDISMLFAPQNIENEIKTLKTEIDALKGVSGSKRELNNKIERINHLRNLKDTISGYREALTLRQRAQANKGAYAEAQKRFAMVPGAEVKTKKGETFKVTSVHPDGRRVKLSNDRLYDAKNLEVVKSPQNLDFHLDTMVSNSIDGLRGAYMNFLKGVAKHTGDHALDSKLEEGFTRVKDYYALNQESYTMADAINALTNPESSRSIFEGYVKAKKDLEAAKAKKVEEGLNTFLSKLENNDLLNELYKAGVFVLPEELKALEEKGTAPTKFLDATTKQEVDKNDAKYKKALEIIKKYNEIVKGKTGEQAEEKPFIQTATGTIRIIRHGETVEDEKGINSGPTQEHITPEGAKHVEDGAKDNTDGLTKIVVSSRQRTKDSAEVIAKGKDIEIVENKDLDPWNTGDEKTGFAKIPDEDWHKLYKWFAVHPDAKVYAGEDAELLTKYADRKLVESFNEFKGRVLNALPKITDQLSDGGAIMTHSNVIQLLKAYVANGSQDNENVGKLFTENEPSKNGEVIEFQRKQVDPTFAPVKKETAAPAIKPTPVHHLTKISQDRALIDIKSRLDKVSNGEELEKLEQDINAEIGAGDYLSDGVEELIDARRRQLATAFNFEDIREGEILLLNDKKWGKVRVISKSNGKIKVRRLNEEVGGTLVIGKKDIHRDIKYKYSKGMKTVKPAELTEAEKKLNAQNIKNNEEFLSDPSMLKALQEEADREGAEKVNKDFFDNLGCK